MNEPLATKQDIVGNHIVFPNGTFKLVEWYQPHLLRAGDLIHIDADSLSGVVRTEKHRAGTEIIHLADGRQILVCGGTEIAVFARS
jgi:hypothetical protein